MNKDVFQARQKTLDKYEKLYSTAKGFRLIAYCAIGAVVIMTFAFCTLATQRRIVPWVVQVDKHGYEIAVGEAKAVDQMDERIVISRIGKFVTNIRSVVTDAEAQKRFIGDVYATIPKGTASFAEVNQFYRSLDPFRGARDKVTTVKVQLQSIIPVSENTWQCEWEESECIKGEEQARRRFTGLFTVESNPTKDLDSVINNPLGIYVTEFSITQNLDFNK